MREVTPTKAILGTAAASLAALGIVVVATTLTAPTPAAAVEGRRPACQRFVTDVRQAAPPSDPVPTRCNGCDLNISF